MNLLNFFKFFLAGFIALGCILSGFAHHGTFTFDGDSVITIEGRITEFNWTNPHSSIHLETLSADGNVYRYVLEADGPSLLGPLGVNADSLTVGEQVIAYVSPEFDYEPGASNSLVLGREIIKEDGTVVSLSVRYARQLQSDRQPTTNQIPGTWVPDLSSLFAFVQARGEWRLTDKGLDAFSNYDVAAPFAHSECIATTSPTLMMYPTAKVISLKGNVIELNADWMGAVRTLYLDEESHPPVNETYLQGHSIATREGNSLLVDTTNFTPNPIGNAFGIPSGAGKHLQEIFTLNDDGRSLSYHFTLVDPEYLLAPATGTFQWHYRPDLQASGIPCNLESAARYLFE